MLIIQLLRKHGLSFLLSAQPETHDVSARSKIDTRGFRHVLYSAVLATDMSLHFVWMSSLQDFGEKVNNEGYIGEPAEEVIEDDRVMICQAIIKCADISNPVSRVMSLR